MKKQKRKLKSLVLNKRTVVRLDNRELKQVQGGRESDVETNCCTFNCNS